MLEKTSQTAWAGDRRARASTGTIRRRDAIPVALPLKTPMKMSGEPVAARRSHLLVRIEAADGSGGSGGPLGADHDRRHAGRAGRRGARPLAPMLVGKDPATGHAATGLIAPARQRRRPFRGRNGGARSDRPRDRATADRSGRPAAPHGVKPMWPLGNKTAERGRRRGPRQAGQGFQLLQPQDRREAVRDEIAIALAVREAPPKTPLCADAIAG